MFGGVITFAVDAIGARIAENVEVAAGIENKSARLATGDASTPSGRIGA